MHKNLAILIGLILLSGCVKNSSKVKETSQLSEQPPVTAEQKTTEVASLDTSQSGRLVFYRDGLLGLAIVPKIRVNGRQFGSVPAASYFSCDVPAGVYEIESKTENTAKITVNVQPNETHYVRASISFGIVLGRVNLEKASEATGDQKISKLKQTKPTCG